MLAVKMNQQHLSKDSNSRLNIIRDAEVKRAMRSFMKINNKPHNFFFFFIIIINMYPVGNVMKVSYEHVHKYLVQLSEVTLKMTRANNHR